LNGYLLGYFLLLLEQTFELRWRRSSFSCQLDTGLHCETRPWIWG